VGRPEPELFFGRKRSRSGRSWQFVHRTRRGIPSLSLQLDQARKQVKQLERRIVEQTLLIERLRFDRHDTAAAERLMATFLDLMTKLTTHREEVEREAEERSRNAR